MPIDRYDIDHTYQMYFYRRDVLDPDQVRTRFLSFPLCELHAEQQPSRFQLVGVEPVNKLERAVSDLIGWKSYSFRRKAAVSAVFLSWHSGQVNNQMNGRVTKQDSHSSAAQRTKSSTVPPH